MGYRVDDTDRKIIAVLIANGRTPVLEIARQIGVVEGTVRKRLERLLAERVIRLSAAVDFESLGYGTHVLFRIQADLGQVEAIARKLAGRPEVVSVWQSTGDSDLTVEAVFSSDRELVSFLREDLAGIVGVGRVDTSHFVSVLKQSSQWRLAQPIARRGGEPPRQPSILIVDDDPAFFEATRAVLELAGYRVSGARSGEEGLAAMRKTRPDLVILELMLAYLLNGLQISQVMSEDDALQAIPILMVSFRPMSEYARLLPTDEPLRASDVLIKPIVAETLLARVGRALSDTMINQSA